MNVKKSAVFKLVFTVIDSPLFLHIFTSSFFFYPTLSSDILLNMPKLSPLHSPMFFLL